MVGKVMLGKIYEMLNELLISLVGWDSSASSIVLLCLWCVFGVKGDFFVFNYLKKNYIFILCLNHICSDWTKVHIRQGPLSHEAYSSNTCYQTYNEFPRERTHTSSIPHEFKQWEFSIVLKYYYFGLH
jgi:hypothetical protein